MLKISTAKELWKICRDNAGKEVRICRPEPEESSRFRKMLNPDPGDPVVELPYRIELDVPDLRPGELWFVNGLLILKVLRTDAKLILQVDDYVMCYHPACQTSFKHDVDVKFADHAWGV